MDIFFLRGGLPTPTSTAAAGRLHFSRCRKVLKGVQFSFFMEHVWQHGCCSASTISICATIRALRLGVMIHCPYSIHPIYLPAAVAAVQSVEGIYKLMLSAAWQQIYVLSCMPCVLSTAFEARREYWYKLNTEFHRILREMSLGIVSAISESKLRVNNCDLILKS